MKRYFETGLVSKRSVAKFDYSLSQHLAVIRHIVLIRFKPEVDQETRKRVFGMFQALPRSIPYLKGWSVGWQMRPDGEYELGEVADFESKEDLEKFRVEPAHLEIKEATKGITTYTVLDHELA